MLATVDLEARLRATYAAFHARDVERVLAVMTAEPMTFTPRPDGSMAVEVHQVARDLRGALLAEGRVLHVSAFRDGLVARMDVEELPR